MENLSNSNKILIVDDEPSIRLFLSEELRDAGYEVITAASGEEALAVLEKQTIDLVLLDLRMPGMDGIQTMTEIRSLPLPPEVIILTAHASLDTAIHAMRLGGDDFLIKPCENAELLTSVQKGLIRRRKSLKRNAMAYLIMDTARQLTEGEKKAVPSADASAHDRYLQGHDLLIDQKQQAVTKGGIEISLTPTEYTLLLTFMSRPDKPLDYVELALEATGQKLILQEARDALGTHLWRLRKKLGSNPQGEPYIINVRGRGYKFAN
ncbi:MAG: response regulator transcription factor [Anaerolineales bacterium]|nr:response regulator transcription factor [Anaerolineales bacterium]